MSSRSTAAGEPRKRTVVLYVVGAGRSGSTLLEMMLGAQDHVVAAGELRHIWSVGFRRDQTCACGRQFSGCGFWKDVVTRLRASGMTKDEPLAVERSIRERGRLRKLAHLIRSRSSSPEEVRSDELISRLYATIAEVSDATVVVDSSKSPLMCMLLAANPGIDLRVLHLVRDGRGVAFSWAQQKPWLGDPDDPAAIMRTHSVKKSCLDWVLANTLSHLCRLRAQAYTRLRYEDFVAQPANSLATVMADLGIDETIDGQNLSDSFHPVAGHSIMGNPIRFVTGEITVRADERWTREMSRRDRLLATVLTAPMLLRYRYRLRPWAITDPTTGASFG